MTSSEMSRSQHADERFRRWHRWRGHAAARLTTPTSFLCVVTVEIAGQPHDDIGLSECRYLQISLADGPRIPRMVRLSIRLPRRTSDAVVGDANNVMFRLSGLAGRSGDAAVMVTSGVRRVAATKFLWGEGENVELKVRRRMEIVFPVVGRMTSPGADGSNRPGRRHLIRWFLVA
jgi:hypothetical protein